MIRARYLLILLLLFFFSTLPEAFAHKPSDSYLRLEYKEDVIEFSWDIALRDLEFAIGLDANGDRNITWGEVKEKESEILTLARSGLTMRESLTGCSVTIPASIQIDTHSDGAYVVLKGKIHCVEATRNGTTRRNPRIDPPLLEYSLFFDIDSEHRGITSVSRNDSVKPFIFTPEYRLLTLYARADDEQPSSTSAISYVLKDGMSHIFNGLDHILFLIVLLLPSVLTAESNYEKAVESFKPAFLKMLKVITAFTVAHCITLSLVVFEILYLPPYLIEAVVALTIVLTALNNVLGVIKESFWIVCALFGLIHGFAFAIVLLDLRLGIAELILALFWFNIGVELGQLLIICAIFPICYMLRKTSFYKSFIFMGGSCVVAAIGLLWTIERFFNLQLLVW